MKRAYLGVNNWFTGVNVGDLSALDAVKRNYAPLVMIKSRGPRMVKIGSAVRQSPPSPNRPLVSQRPRRVLRISPVERPTAFLRAPS